MFSRLGMLSKENVSLPCLRNFDSGDTPVTRRCPRTNQLLQQDHEFDLRHCFHVNGNLIVVYDLWRRVQGCLDRGSRGESAGDKDTEIVVELHLMSIVVSIHHTPNNSTHE